MKIQVVALVLAFCLVFLPATLAGPTRKAEDVFGVEKDSEGRFWFEHEGAKWYVVDNDEHNQPYYWNEDSKESTWVDPRMTMGEGPAGSQIPDNWNPLGQSIEIDLGNVKPPRASATSVMIAAIVPVMLFIGAMIGRIWYLQTYHPELLWPTKERKNRYRNNNKFKPQKSRGKMSQDGKGGRSANS